MTLEEIYARCTEDGDCLIWTGPANNYRHPTLSGAAVRRIVWRLLHGEIPDGKLVTTNCGDSLCLCKDHLVLTTKSEVSLKVAQRHDYALRKAASNARTAREKFGLITMDIARDIRESDKTGVALAAELGVSVYLISNVRTHKSWREHSNPFAGLMR